MKIFRTLNEPLPVKNAVVTTGSFDGVHLGHKVILNRITTLAKQCDGESVLVTFHPHPRKVLFPDTAGKELRLINTQREKITLLQKTGLDCLVIIEFTWEFSRMSSLDFIRKILVKQLHTKRVVVGFNHFFGHNREGDFEQLREMGNYYGFGVEEIPQQDIDNETVSSTKIRQALHEGRIQRANAYLDHYYIIIGELITCNPLPMISDMKFYRLLIDEDVKLIPPEGLYAISCEIGGIRYRGMLNIKNTLAISDVTADKMTLELHLFENDRNFEGTTVTVCFHKRIRNLLNFKNISEYSEQLARDKAVINELIY